MIGPRLLPPCRLGSIDLLWNQRCLHRGPSNTTSFPHYPLLSSPVPSYTPGPGAALSGSRGDGGAGCGRETRPLIFHYKSLHILIWGLMVPRALKKQPQRCERAASKSLSSIRALFHRLLFSFCLSSLLSLEAPHHFARFID